MSKRFTHLYDHAHQCLLKFVQDMPNLFHPQSVVYNVHILLHLHEFVLNNGTLDDYSAFPFENFLHILKSRIKQSNNVFQQSLSQLQNIRSIYTSNIEQPLLFSNKSPNNCAILEDGTYVVVTQADSNIVTGYVLTFIKPLYTYPYNSNVIGIGFFKPSEKLVRRKLAYSKAFFIPYDQHYLIIPFC